MDYSESLAYLYKAYGSGTKKGFIYLQKALDQLGNPHNKLRVIHVSGTNGKGSVCAMLDSILREAGYKVGLFTSPHLVRYNERMKINGSEITDEEFARQISTVKAVSEEVLKNNQSGLIDSSDNLVSKHSCFSYFEILTIAAYNYFCETNVDFAIIETGIGGRLDSTNIVKNPVLTVITAIGMDHTEYLGDTIDKITYEKAGIIKNNCPCVLYLPPLNVYNIVNNISHEKNSAFYCFRNDNHINYAVSDLKFSENATEFSIISEYFDYKDIKLNLLGKHQIDNACTALLCIQALRDSGITVSETAVYSGLERVVWHGRMEIFDKDTLTILDGAHNIDGVKTCVDSIKLYFRELTQKRIILIIGILKSKDHREMVRQFTEIADEIIFTRPISGKAVPPQELLEVFHELKTGESKIVTFVTKDHIQALILAREHFNNDSVIVVAGSLYLVGDILASE